MRRLGCLAAMLAFNCTGPALAAPAQVAFFNHAFAVLDAGTTDAIAHSSYLRRFGVFEIRTTVADRGERWTGRYLAGRQTYLELFGPKDLEGSQAGATGLGLSPDRVGGLATITAHLIAGGITTPDTGRRTRRVGNDLVPWFDLVSPPGDAETLSIWAMEYLPSYLDDPRMRKPSAAFAGDVSRRRYQSNDYAGHVMRDISSLEIAATSKDVGSASILLAAAGFRISRSGKQLTARDADTTIMLDTVSRMRAGICRVDFVLNAPAALHVEHLGHSTLTVGPGPLASWRFDPSP